MKSLERKHYTLRTPISLHQCNNLSPKPGIVIATAGFSVWRVYRSPSVIFMRFMAHMGSEAADVLRAGTNQIRRPPTREETSWSAWFGFSRTDTREETSWFGLRRRADHWPDPSPQMRPLRLILVALQILMLSAPHPLIGAEAEFNGRNCFGT